MTYLPKGCDQQGRHPQAAEACTELGAEDDELASKPYRFIIDILLACMLVGAIYFVISMVV